MPRSSNSGFTLLEIILVIALISILTGITIPVYQSYQNRNDLESTLSLVKHLLSKAQLMSQASVLDSSWGVHLEQYEITLFRGSDFSSRDTTFDQTTQVYGGSVVDGEVVFEKFTGHTTTTDIDITNSNETLVVNINQNGIAE
jgi:prepilin-type N-terminal cleavage/methylation domain-containing protein